MEGIPPSPMSSVSAVEHRRVLHSQIVTALVLCTAATSVLLAGTPPWAPAARWRAMQTRWQASPARHPPHRTASPVKLAELPSTSFAELAWVDGEPVSTRFRDVYYSAAGGLAEARYVFLEGNALAVRLADSAVLTISETGFGTGLNFLAAWQLWDLSSKPQGAELRVVSVEKYPLLPEDLRRAHRTFPELQQYSEQLLLQYSSLQFHAEGPHMLMFADGRVRLELWIGDVSDVLPQWPTAGAGAWFLDGFSPDRNGDMWSDAVLAEVVRTLAPGGSVATFTAVGRIRRKLADLGLAVQKRKGFGTKRDMTVAVKPH